jgi:hypothetical protein
MNIQKRIMEIEKGETYKYLWERIEVSQAAKDNLKQFIRIKKSITDALQKSDLTIEQLTQKLDISKHEKEISGYTIN